MKILAKYIHGSEDSLDIDTCYLVDSLPSDIECKKFCEEHSINNENPNIAEIKNGTLSAVYKGTIDEFNNSLRATYALHLQTDPMLLTRDLERDVFLKIIRVIRCILSYFSRTSLRTDIKRALKSKSLTEKLEVLKMIDLSQAHSYTGKANSVEDAKKVLAFQLGQVLALCCSNTELYTKSDIRQFFKGLTKYMNRCSLPLTDENSHLPHEWNNSSIEDQYRLLCSNYVLLCEEDRTLQEYLSFFIAYIEYCIQSHKIVCISEGTYIHNAIRYNLLQEKIINITQYVLGLAFSEDKQSIVLIRKNRPSFLAGLLNGVGGHIEQGESAIQAMQREFKEETNIDTNIEQWQGFTTEYFNDYTLHWFTTQLSEKQLTQLTSLTDESVAIYNIATLNSSELAPDLLKYIKLSM